MNILITGASGFIGYHLAHRLAKLGQYVVGIDNLNDYYDVHLKKNRLKLLQPEPAFRFVEMDLADQSRTKELFAEEDFDRVVHLGAQAGVRYSIDNPMAYVDSNLVGHMNVLEGCRHTDVEHLVYASSSSVYGLNSKTPFATTDSVDHPVSLYAATKKSNELMSHAYSHLYGLPTTGLRFFTVYGPWGRPDMAPIKFAKLISQGKPIDVYNNGNLSRDFTYIDDIVEGVVRVLGVAPSENKDWTPESGLTNESSAPYRLYNIGCGNPVNLMNFITELERALGKKAQKNFMEMQPGDVYTTWADTQDLFKATGYQPRVSLEEGVARFVHWFRQYYE